MGHGLREKKLMGKKKSAQITQTTSEQTYEKLQASVLSPKVCMPPSPVSPVERRHPTQQQRWGAEAGVHHVHGTPGPRGPQSLLSVGVLQLSLKGKAEVSWLFFHLPGLCLPSYFYQKGQAQFQICSLLALSNFDVLAHSVV